MYISGIKGEVQYHQEIATGIKVKWLEWNSNFRDTALDVGAIIIEIDGKPIEAFATEDGRLQFAPTLFSEKSYWEKNGYPKGNVLNLKAKQGEKLIAIEESLVKDEVYSKNMHTLLGPKGAIKNSNDGFNSSWGSWYENIIKNLSVYLGDFWRKRSGSNEVELRSLMNNKERIIYLQNNHNNKLVEVLVSDFEKAVESLSGKVLNAEDVDLTYRTLQNQIKEECALRAKNAWKTLEEKYKNQLTSQYVDINSFDKNKTNLVITPWLTYRNSIEDIGKGYFMIGDSRNGMYHICMNSEKMDLFYDTLFRYKSEVNPKISERFRFMGKIVNNPRMLTYDGKQQCCLEVEPIVALSGNSECYVDLETNPVTFEAEELTEDKIVPKPTVDQGAAAFMDYYFHLVKMGYFNQWKDCYSKYFTTHDFMWNPFLQLDYTTESRYITTWDNVRRLVLDKIVDIRIEEIETLQETVETNGIVQSVELINVWVDYYSNQKDLNEYRSFKDLTVFRGWRLINIDNTGWKIDGLRGLRGF